MKLLLDQKRVDKSISKSTTTCESIASVRSGLASGFNEAFKRLIVQVDNLSLRICAAERTAATISSALSTFETHTRSATNSLNEQLEGQRNRMELQTGHLEAYARQQAREEANRILGIVRAEQGGRIAHLEAESRESLSNYNNLAEHVDKEVHEIRVDAQIHDRDSKSHLSESIQPLKEAIAGVAEEMQMLLRSFEQRDSDFRRVDSQLRTLEVRVLPWRDRNRSPSPPREELMDTPPPPWLPTTSTGLPFSEMMPLRIAIALTPRRASSQSDPSSGLPSTSSWTPQAPKGPSRSRPASGTSRRRDRQEVQTPVQVARTLKPAGAGFAAVRCVEEAKNFQNSLVEEQISSPVTSN